MNPIHQNYGHVKAIEALLQDPVIPIYPIVPMLQDGNIDSAENRKAHVEAIHAKQNAIKAGVCPRCGGQLVERNGRYGKFMGCSNYPKCRYVQNM